MEYIVVALDNNNEAWYEMFIPFISSLKVTNYTGQVAVLAYGLDPSKIDRLEENDIIVVSRNDAVTRIENDRYFAINKLISQYPDCEKVALYDADIWFACDDMDLFAHVKDEQKLYACTDVWASRFIKNCIIGPNKGALEYQCIYEASRLYGNVLQAGLIAGTRSAWQKFTQFYAECVSRVGIDFIDDYGLDTVIINLYASGENCILIDSRYNYIPKRGIVVASPRNLRTISSDRIVGLHMIGETRYFHRWRYYNLSPELAIEGGQLFTLGDDQMHSFGPHSPPDEFHKDLAMIGWRFVEARAFGGLTFIPKLTGDAIMPTSSGLFVTNGSVEITLESTATGVKTDILTSYATCRPCPIRIGLVIDGQRKALGYPAFCSIQCSEGDRVILWTEALPGQKAGMFWGMARK